jgi:hypothetical protein
MSALPRFREAQRRAQQHRDDSRWIASVEAASRVARVSRGEDRRFEVRLDYDANAVAAVKGCRAGRDAAAWDPDRRLWRVPAAIWPCVRGSLVDLRYRIEGA